MALLQAIFSLVSRSASTVLNSIFGWAVTALFGRASPKEKTLLSGLVAMAAAWPLLLVGIAFPKLAALLIAFVPLSSHVPDSVVRIVWIVLAGMVPIVVGLVVAARGGQGTRAEPVFKRVLRGFPITLAIASAFVLMFFTVPVLQVISMFKKRKDNHLAVIPDAGAYDAVAHHIDGIFAKHELKVERAAPPWWLAAPAAILRGLGGKALGAFMPEHLAYWQGSELEVALHPSDLLIRGPANGTAYFLGILTEGLVHARAVQTFDPLAQKLERRIRELWNLNDSLLDVRKRGVRLAPELPQLIRELSTLKISSEDWQVLYRELMQVSRALAGESQLLDSGTNLTDLQAVNNQEIATASTGGAYAPAPLFLEGQRSRPSDPAERHLTAVTEPHARPVPPPSSLKPARQSHPWFKKARYWVLLTLALLVGAAFIGWHPLVKYATRRALSKIPAYEGDFEDARVHLVPLKYEITHLRLFDENLGAKSPPLLYARYAEVDLEWKQLLRGHLVARAMVDGAKITLHASPSAAAPPSPKEPSPWDLLHQLPDFDFDRIQVTNSQVLYTLGPENEDQPIWLHDLEATVENVATREGRADIATTVAIRGVLQHSGKVSVFLTADPLAKRITFAGEAKVLGLQVIDLYQLIDSKTDITLSRGTVDVLAKFKAAEGKLSGGVQPVLKMAKVAPTDTSLPNKLKAWVVDTALKIFSDRVPGRDAVSTVIPIEGSLTQPDIQLWPTVFGVLRNAFVEGISESFGHLPPPKAASKEGPVEQAKKALSKDAGVPKAQPAAPKN